MKNQLLALLFVALAPGLAAAQTNLVGQAFKPAPPEAALAEFKNLAEGLDDSIVRGAAVQQNGRVKPLETLARETMLFVNGRYSRWGLTPTQEYLALLLSPSSPWIELVEVRSPKIRRELGFLKTQRFVSLADLEQSKLNERVAPLMEIQQNNSRQLSSDEKEWIELYGQMSTLQSIIAGEHLIGALDFSHLFTDGAGSTMATTREKLMAYLNALKTGGGAESAAHELVTYTRTQRTPDLFRHYVEALDFELLFNRVNPFFWAAILYVILGGVLLYGGLKRGASMVIFLLPLLLQIAGIGMRVYITRFAPVTNMYGTMIWVALGVNVFSFLLFYLYGNSVISGVMLVVSGTILFLAQSFPLILSPDLDPIVAVLRNNFWLSTHVTTITISYAAFSIAMVLGNITLIRSLYSRSLSFIPEFERHAYRAVQLGCFLLTVGIILGGVWADYSWGRFWGWDPKETWALIADMSFLALLHARYIGWARGFTFLALTPVAYLMVLMAWYGVNFILAAGLHSYGFSSGGALAVSIFVAIQLVLLGVAGLRVWTRRQS